MNLEDLLLEVDKQGKRDELLDEVTRLRKTLPEYTPLDEVYEMAHSIVTEREKQKNPSN